ncbi:MAG: hypothetical protein ACEPOW_04385 [Bacteroidales bacterium]
MKRDVFGFLKENAIKRNISKSYDDGFLLSASTGKDGGNGVFSILDINIFTIKIPATC